MPSSSALVCVLDSFASSSLNYFSQGKVPTLSHQGVGGVLLNCSVDQRSVIRVKLFGLKVLLPVFVMPAKAHYCPG